MVFMAFVSSKTRPAAQILDTDRHRPRMFLAPAPRPPKNISQYDARDGASGWARGQHSASRHAKCFPCRNRSWQSGLVACGGGDEGLARNPATGVPVPAPAPAPVRARALAVVASPDGTTIGR